VWGWCGGVGAGPGTRVVASHRAFPLSAHKKPALSPMAAAGAAAFVSSGPPLDDDALALDAPAVERVVDHIAQALRANLGEADSIGALEALGLLWERRAGSWSWDNRDLPRHPNRHDLEVREKQKRAAILLKLVPHEPPHWPKAVATFLVRPARPPPADMLADEKRLLLRASRAARTRATDALAMLRRAPAKASALVATSSNLRRSAACYLAHEREEDLARFRAHLVRSHDALTQRPWPPSSTTAAATTATATAAATRAYIPRCRGPPHCHIMLLTTRRALV
jgi:hypothetical protein